MAVAAILLIAAITSAVFGISIAADKAPIVLALLTASTVTGLAAYFILEEE